MFFTTLEMTSERMRTPVIYPQARADPYSPQNISIPLTARWPTKLSDLTLTYCSTPLDPCIPWTMTFTIFKRSRLGTTSSSVSLVNLNPRGGWVMFLEQRTVISWVQRDTRLPNRPIFLARRICWSKSSARNALKGSAILLNAEGDPFDLEFKRHRKRPFLRRKILKPIIYRTIPLET